jgi:hypothetical protein
MPKTKISEFDSVAANNTDIDGINLGEGMLPSDVNNAIRELMAQLKDLQGGVSGDPITGLKVVVSALGTLTTGTTTLNLSTAQVFTATITAANTITLAFSNAPAAGTSQVVLLRLTDAGGGTIVYPASTKFAAGTAPVFTASGVDVIGIYYDVTTTTYMVFVIGLDVKAP